MKDRRLLRKVKLFDITHNTQDPQLTLNCRFESKPPFQTQHPSKRNALPNTTFSQTAARQAYYFVVAGGVVDRTFHSSLQQCAGHGNVQSSSNQIVVRASFMTRSAAYQTQRVSDGAMPSRVSTTDTKALYSFGCSNTLRSGKNIFPRTEITFASW